jgi:hypothetical protein
VNVVNLLASQWGELMTNVGDFDGKITFGHYEGKPEIIAADSSPVMLEVERSEFSSAADASTILEQIEGALAYLDTVGTRAEDAVYKRLRLKLTAAYRQLHNEMHRRGHYHGHTP